MSKRNRDRHALSRKWRCEKCGMRLLREIGERANRQLAELARQFPTKKVQPLIHMCMGCKTPHYEEPDRMRRLTPAEVFGVMMRVPALLEAAERGELPIGNLVVDISGD